MGCRACKCRWLHFACVLRERNCPKLLHPSREFVLSVLAICHTVALSASCVKSRSWTEKVLRVSHNRDLAGTKHRSGLDGSRFLRNCPVSRLGLRKARSSCRVNATAGAT